MRTGGPLGGFAGRACSVGAAFISALASCRGSRLTTLWRPAQKIVGRWPCSRSALRWIRRPVTQTQVGARSSWRSMRAQSATGYGGSTMNTAGRLQRHAFDAAVVALALGAQIEVWTGSVHAPRGALAALVVLWTLGLLLRRRFPFAAPVFVFSLCATASFVDREAVSSLDTGAFALLLAFWAVGAQDEARQAAAGVAIGGATVAVLIERDLRVDPSEGIQEVIAGAALALSAFVLERRARRAAALEERAVRFEREREEREPALRPQPGLADLEELVAQAGHAGLPVELVIEGTPVLLPAGVDLAAYRIVQEALTNTRKHAGPARASVAVRYGPDALELEISDDGRPGANGGGGHGL